MCVTQMFFTLALLVPHIWLGSSDALRFVAARWNPKNAVDGIVSTASVKQFGLANTHLMDKKSIGMLLCVEHNCAFVLHDKQAPIVVSSLWDGPPSTVASHALQRWYKHTFGDELNGTEFM